MNPFPHSGVLFVSLNPAEHIAVTLPGGMLDSIQKSGLAREDQFVFFTSEEGSLLRIDREEYELLKKFPPLSPFDENLKKLVSEYYITNS